MPIMAKAAVANNKQIALLMRFMVLVGIPRIRLRDELNEERCALDGAVAFENVELVVGDNFEKRGSAGWDGACSKFIGNSAKDFVHGSVFVVAIKPFAVFAGFGVSAPLLSLLKSQTTFNSSVWFVDAGMVKTNDLVGGHGSAGSKFLSHQELHLFHLFRHLAFCCAASSPVTASKAMLIFGLRFCQQFLCKSELGFDGVHGLLDG